MVRNEISIIIHITVCGYHIISVLLAKEGKETLTMVIHQYAVPHEPFLPLLHVHTNYFHHESNLREHKVIEENHPF